MSRRYYYYHHNYGQYHQNEPHTSLNRNTLGIRETWQAFLTLDNKQLAKFFQLYLRSYGESAYKYACKQYPLWKAGHGTNPAYSTLKRILNLVPKVLYEEQRQIIFKKWMDSVLKSLPNDLNRPSWIHGPTEYIHTDWDNFHPAITNVINKIEGECAQFNYSTWYDKSDMATIFPSEYQYIKQVVDMHMKRVADNNFKDAIQTLQIFKEKCEDLKLHDQVYSPASIEINTPSRIYSIRIQEKTLSFFEKIKRHLWG